MNAFLANSQSAVVDWLYERRAGWYLYNSATGKLIPVPSRSIRNQKQGADRSFKIGEVGEVPVRSGESRLMTRFDAHSVPEVTSIRLDEPVVLHPDNLSEGGYDRSGGHAEQI